MTAAAGPPAGLVVRGLDVLDGDRVVVAGLSFRVAAGETLLVRAASGADASAVLAALAGRGRGRPAAATTLDDRPLTGDVPAHRLGYVAADHRLVGTLTAAENLVAVLLAEGLRPPQALLRRAERQLEAVGLPTASWHNLVEQLSGGQQQRVALARALVARPRLVVLDDPTSELDPDSAARVVQVLDRAVRHGACCVLATSDEVVEAWCADGTELRLNSGAYALTLTPGRTAG